MKHIPLRVHTLLVISIAVCSLLLLLFSQEGGHGYVEDNAHILAVDQVGQAAQHLSCEVDIFTLPFTGNEHQLMQVAQQELMRNTLAGVLVIAIDTLHHRIAIVGNLSVSIQLDEPHLQEAAHVFLDSYRHHHSYTEATVITLLLLSGDLKSQTLINGLLLGVSLLFFWGLLTFFSRVPKPCSVPWREGGIE